MFQNNSTPKSSRITPIQPRLPLPPQGQVRLPNWNGLLIPSFNLPNQPRPPFNMQPNQQIMEAPPMASLAPAPNQTTKIFRLAEENHGMNMNNAFEMFRKKQLLLDINILVQGRNFWAHKMMLCAASPYFKKSILSIRLPTGHGTPEQNFICIVIDKCTPDQFGYLLDYIYQGEVNVPEKDLAGVLRAAEDLQISGLFGGLQNGHKMQNGHHKPDQDAGAKSNNATTASPTQSRPSSGGSNESNASVKTGSSRKKGQPKKLILHHNNHTNNTPPESQSPSPDSYYAPSNDSPPADENRRPTPSSSRSSHEGPHENNGHPMPMDFSAKPVSNSDDSEERPLVIHEADQPAQPGPSAKRNRLDNILQNAQNVPVTSSAAANQLLQTMKQNMSWMGAANPFSMMHHALNQQAGGEPNRTSSESSGVDHDSEREELPKNRLPHPSLPGMNPQDMIQKLQQAFMNNAASNGGNPGFAPWANGSPSLLNMGHGLPVTTASFSNLLPPPLQSMNGSPTRDSPAPSTSRGIPAGIGPNGKPAVSCEVCGKTLADPSSLYRHRKIHNGEKPHKCPFCGRKFIQRYNMTQHIKTHFKPRGINSLANNPATLANFLASNRETLASYQIPNDMLNGLVNGQQFEPADVDTNRYDEEAANNQSVNEETKAEPDDTNEEIDPC